MTWPPAQPNQPTPDGERGAQPLPGDPWTQPAVDAGHGQFAGSPPPAEAWTQQTAAAGQPAEAWAQQTTAFRSPDAWAQQQTWGQQQTTAYPPADAWAQQQSWGQQQTTAYPPADAWGQQQTWGQEQTASPVAAYPGAPTPDTLYSGPGGPGAPRHPVPRKSRTGLLVVAAAGVLVLVGGAAFGVTKLAANLISGTTASAQPSASPPAASGATTQTPADVPTTIIKQSTQPLAAGQTRVVDKADGLTLVLPKGWSQAPTSPKQLAAWVKKAQAKNPNLKLSPQQLSQFTGNVAVFAVYTGAKTPTEGEYFMVTRSPTALPPITEEALPFVQRGLTGTKGLQDVTCRMTTVAGAPAIQATMSLKLTTATGTIRLYGQEYVVNSPTANGFLVTFYTRVKGDPRGDIKTVMSSFDPNYTG